MIPVHSNIGREIRVQIERVLNRHGRDELILVYIEETFSTST